MDEGETADAEEIDGTGAEVGMTGFGACEGIVGGEGATVVYCVTMTTGGGCKGVGGRLSAAESEEKAIDCCT